MLTGTMYRLLVLFDDTDIWTFADLCKRAGFSLDLGAYYIRQLVRDGYLENVARGTYAITPAGSLRLSLAIDKQSPSSFPQPRIIIVLVPQCGVHGVLLRRSIQPRINMLEWPGGMVAQGEDMPSAVRRLSKRYFGKAYAAEFAGFFRKMEHLAGETFDDKLLAIHKVHIPTSDTVISQNEIGALVLYPWSHIPGMSRAPKNLLDIHEFVSMPYPRPYIERVYDLLPNDFSPNTP